MVSDVHGNVEALAKAGAGADALVVLGDLIDFVNYLDHSGGILGAVFGPDKVATFARLRRERRHAELGEFHKSLWAQVDDPVAVIEEAVRGQYEAMFGALAAAGVPVYATPGNVDVPAVWPEFAAAAGVRVLDGEVAEIGGLRFGFVGGGLLAPGVTLRPGAVFRPYLRPEEDFAAAAAALGEVDVLCSHIPPAVAELTYDVLARRFESGSRSLLDTVDARRPRWSLFGHVHQPLAPRLRRGLTECVNVGHFQRAERPYVVAW